jgi:hypothetical protein
VHNTLTTEMQKRVRHHVDRISVDTDLDADIREELYDHFEDRMLEYLSGDEAITEEDAFLLVSDRFGAPDRVEAGLRETHERTPVGTILRRIGIVLAATIAVDMLLPIGKVMRVVVVYKIMRNIFPSGSRHIMANFLHAVWPLVVVYALWVMVRRMRDRGLLPVKPWYQRIRAGHFFLLIIGLFVLQQVIPTLIAYYMITISLWSRRFSIFPAETHLAIYEFVPRIFTGSGFISTFGRTWISTIYLAAQLAAWLWWCDMPLASIRRRMRLFAGIVMAWTGYLFAIALFIPRIFFHMPNRVVEMSIGWPQVVMHNGAIYINWYIPWIASFFVIGAFVAAAYLSLSMARQRSVLKDRFAGVSNA